MSSGIKAISKFKFVKEILNFLIVDIANKGHNWNKKYLEWQASRM